MLKGNNEKKVFRTITLAAFALFSLFVSNAVAKELGLSYQSDIFK